MCKCAENQRQGGAHQVEPSVNNTGALMAALLESAVVDAGKDFNAIAELLGEAMTALPSVGSEAVESVLVEMIGRLQCFDLLSQRMGHVAQVLNAVAEVEAPEQLKFSAITDDLWRVYSCQAERTIHNDFLRKRGLHAVLNSSPPDEG